MKDGKLHCPKTIDAAHTRYYHGRKMGQAVTIELSTMVLNPWSNASFELQLIDSTSV